MGLSISRLNDLLLKFIHIFSPQISKRVLSGYVTAPVLHFIPLHIIHIAKMQDLLVLIPDCDRYVVRRMPKILSQSRPVLKLIYIMKSTVLLKATCLVWLAISTLFISCKDDDPVSANPLCDPTENVMGLSLEEWQIQWWQYLMSLDCDHLGLASSLPQSFDLYFLSSPAGNFTYDVTIPKDKMILCPLVNYINDFPCPDTSFHPAPGQSLEDFLQEGAEGFIDDVTDRSITLDGVVYPIDKCYRFVTPLFYFTGDPSLPLCFDPCVTGTSQAAVSDGYWVVLKPLSKGKHTLNIKWKHIPFTLNSDVTYNITVE